MRLLGTLMQIGALSISPKDELANGSAQTDRNLHAPQRVHGVRAFFGLAVATQSWGLTLFAAL